MDTIYIGQNSSLNLYFQNTYHQKQWESSLSVSKMSKIRQNDLPTHIQRESSKYMWKYAFTAINKCLRSFRLQQPSPTHAASSQSNKYVEIANTTFHVGRDGSHVALWVSPYITMDSVC